MNHRALIQYESKIMMRSGFAIIAQTAENPCPAQNP
jgi:hypothetical protein